MRRIGDKPMIEWTIRAALGAEYIDDVWVSTDSIFCIKLAESLGVRAFTLNSSDYTDSDGAVKAVVNACRLGSATDYDSIIMLLPTCPFRNSSHIDEAYETWRINRNWASTLISASPLLVEDKKLLMCVNDRVSSLTPHTGILRSNGAIQIARRDQLLAFESFRTVRCTVLYLMSHIDGLDIDTIDDLREARVEATKRAREDSMRCY